MKKIFYLLLIISVISCTSKSADEVITPQGKTAGKHDTTGTTTSGTSSGTTSTTSGACDISNVTFSRTVSSILNSNCVSCHSAIVPSDGIMLDTYSGASSVASDGRLYGSITHASGYHPMPQNAPMLSSCDIAKIKKWIDDGAPNN